MDLLFKRYASPFPLLDMIIQLNRFSEFVDEVLEAEGEQKLWDLYLHHKILDKSFVDFKKSVMKTPTNNIKMTDEDIEATIQLITEAINNL